MKIENKPKSRRRAFGDLIEGEVFIINNNMTNFTTDDVYMKCCNMGTSGDLMVNLETGKISTGYSEMAVEVLNAEIVFT